MKLPFYRQLETNDCGPACIRMISAYYKKYYKLQTIRDFCNITRVGITPLDIINGCNAIGMEGATVQLKKEELLRMPLPGILYWNQEHYIVLYKIAKSDRQYVFHIADPSIGKIKVTEDIFMDSWKGGETHGIAILVQPTDDFYTKTPDQKSILKDFKDFWATVKGNVKKHKNQFTVVSLLSLLAVVFNWISPFLFQEMVDKGIGNTSMNLVLVLVILQFAFFIGYTFSSSVSTYIQTKVGFKIGIDFLYRYLNKLVKLPVSFYDTRLNTDLIQRISDQKKVEIFLTRSLNLILLSILNLIAFSAILCYYNVIIFLIYFITTAMAICYNRIFLNRRTTLDYLLFSVESSDKNNVYELINGMTEIKINSAQNTRIAKWQSTQEKINKINLKLLLLDFYSRLGGNFFGRLNEILITAGCAYFVIRGNMTLGVMMTVIYILGQLFSSTNTIISFVNQLQDTKIAFDRIEEIYKVKDEDENKLLTVPPDIKTGVEITGASFKYPGTFSPYVLKDLNLKINKSQVTAIVGTSGSGKSTLIKLLLSFYYPQKGTICLDNIEMCRINPDDWRKRCGVVMQDGKLFSGTIMENIALSDVNPDPAKVKEACRIACIDEFVEGLPMKYNTKIGGTGINLSGGQIQRILIARTVYRDPEFIFFDEATSSLDANNERKIMNNLNSFYKGKTVVIVAHRLSTVKNADKIVFLENGRIIEEGTHKQLTDLNGAYYNLVKNQLEMGT